MEEQQITLQIDHHFITVPAGTTLLEAARKIGIDIPTLCHINLKGTCIKNNPASCRICVVEVAGRRNLAPACATRCTEGMVVKTSTLRVMNARKVVAELILSDHPNDCLTCPKCGNCELQTLALRFNIREMPFNGGELSPRKREVRGFVYFIPANGKCPPPLCATWTSVSSAADAKASATMYRQSAHWEPSAADSTQR